MVGEWGARVVKSKTPVIFSQQNTPQSIVHRERANPEDKKLWVSIPQISLHLCLLPTQAIGVQTVANSPSVASYTQFLWLTLLLFTEKRFFFQVQKNSFANPHKQHGLPNKLLHRVIFLKCFSGSSNEGEKLSLNNVFCVPCNSLDASMSRQGCPWFCSFQHQTQLTFPGCPPSRDVWNLTGTPSALYLTKRVISY